MEKKVDIPSLKIIVPFGKLFIPQSGLFLTYPTLLHRFQEYDIFHSTKSASSQIRVQDVHPSRRGWDKKSTN